MDINWRDFDESLARTNVLADYQVANQTQLLIWLTAWCDPTPNV